MYLRPPLHRAAAALLIGATATMTLVGTAAAADDLTITNVTDDGATVTIDFSIPADVLAVLGENGVAVDDAVTAYENGTAVADAALTPVPMDQLEVVLVVDVSSNMSSAELNAAKAAAEEFVSRMPDGVSIGVVSFADTPSLVLPLTPDRNRTVTAIEGLLPAGDAALYDSIVFSEVLFSGTTDDRQLVVLSAGADSASLNSVDAALDVASKIRTNVIELATGDSDTATLEQLADSGKGLFESADSTEVLTDAYVAVASDLLNRYRLSFPISAVGTVDYRVALDTGADLLSDTVTAEVQLATTTTAATTTTVSVTVDTSGDKITDPFTSGASSGGLWLVGIGAFFVAFLLLLLFLTAPNRNRAQQLNARLARGGGTPDGNPIRSLSSLAERILSRGGRDRALARNLDIAGIPMRAGEFVLTSGLGGLILFLVLALLMNGTLAAIIAVVATPFLARTYLQRRIRNRRAKFVEQLPDVLQTMVASLRAGYGLPQALDVAATQAPEPTRSELQRVQFESRIGRDPGEALQSVADRMASDDFNWVVSAMQINREVGGELAMVLDNVGETVRERQKLRRQIDVLTAEGRLSAYVLTALPFLLAGAILVTNPDYFDPLSSGGGLVLVFLGVILLGIGWVWIRRIVKEEY